MPNYITDPNDITLSEREETLYLLGNPPSWMTRYGIIVGALFFSILLTLSYLIEYPDIVTCRVVLTTENPPIRVFSPSTNRLSALFVHENQSVTEGSLLAVLENTANWQDVLKLEKILLSPPTPRGGFLGTEHLTNLLDIQKQLLEAPPLGGYKAFIPH